MISKTDCKQSFLKQVIKTIFCSVRLITFIYTLFFLLLLGTKQKKYLVFFVFGAILIACKSAYLFLTLLSVNITMFKLIILLQSWQIKFVPTYIFSLASF